MPDNAHSQLRVLLLTDLVDSTRIVAELGDARAHQLLLSHDRLARDLLHQFGGLEIDKSDGFLALFEHAASAVRFALAYHESLRQFSAQSGVQWRARIGVHRGEVFVHHNSAEDIARGAKPVEVDGLAKPVAARLMSLAQSGQTLLSASVFDAARNDDRVTEGHTLSWLAHGRYRLKGVDEPFAVFEVGVPGQAPLCRPPDSDKAQREVSPAELQLLGWRPGPQLLIPERPQWRLLRKLGAGGFAEVWLAEHITEHSRRVFKFCHDADLLRSLKREVTVFRLLREALGDRRDIARIIDWQLTNAPFFLEIEYVDGGDLLAWSAQQGGLAAVPLAQRIEIVAQLAEAVAAAHSVGVLHKDIKPANVLISTDDAGAIRVVLTDFGIGLVTDKSQLLARGITMAGFTELIDSYPTAGSQLYMAPELLEGKPASIQADLFAMGVMLYELGAGEFKPLAPGWQRDIADELLAADIAALVDGDPARRPTSAARVARDLHDLPERRLRLAAERKASADAEATRSALAKSQRRWRWASGLTAVLVLVALAVGYSAYQTALARDEATLRRNRAEQLIGFMLDDLRERLTKVGRLDVMDSVTDAAMAYFKGIPTDQVTDADLAARSKVLYQIGDTQFSRGNFEGAKQAMAESLDLAQALSDRSPNDPQRQFDLAQSEYWVGFVELRAGRPDAALQHFQRYLDIAQWLVAKDPQRREWQAELGYAYSNLGTALEAKGDYIAAVANYRIYLGTLSSQGRAQQADTATSKELATANGKLGRALELAHDLPGALQHYRNEQALLRPLAAAAPDDAPLARRLATSRHYAARLLFQQGHVDAAASEQQSALADFEALLQRDADNARWRRDLVFALQWAAHIDLQRGATASAAARSARARALAQPLIASMAEILPPQHLLDAQIAFARGDHAATQVFARAVIDANEPFSATSADATRQEHLAEAQLWRAKATAKPEQEPLRAALTRLQSLQPPSLRNLALQARLLLALGQPEQAQPIVQHLLSLGYRHGPFVTDCLAAGIAVSRASISAAPTQPR